MRILTRTQREQFETQGYVVVEGVLDAEKDFAPILADFAQLLDGISHALYLGGRIASAYEDLPFTNRFIQVSTESGLNLIQEFEISLPQSGVKLDTPIHACPAAFRLLTTPRLLDLIEDMIGPEIYSNPVQHVRMKLPKRAVATSGTYSGLISQVPWHQDNGVILPEADESKILTVWFPVTPSTLENGCLQVIPGSHRRGLIAHCPAQKGLTIPDGLLPEQKPVPLPMNPGSVLLMTSRTIHSSLENRTENEVRISFDLRYEPVGQPTGRPMFPGFVARSKAHPETVVKDAAAWEALWHQARTLLARQSDPTFNRWHAGVGVCA